jgi:hypothetical protein
VGAPIAGADGLFDIGLGAEDLVVVKVREERDLTWSALGRRRKKREAIEERVLSMG